MSRAEADIDVTSGGETPLNDEGGATPVQDEKSDPEPTVPKVPAPRENPIEFLTQLITQTRKTTASSNSSTSLIESLSLLTGGSKPESASPLSAFEQANSSPSQNQGGSTPSSWAQWKAQQPPSSQEEVYNAPPPPPPPPQDPYALPDQANYTSNSSVPYTPTSPQYNPMNAGPEQQQPNFAQNYTPSAPPQHMANIPEPPSNYPQGFNTSPVQLQGQFDIPPERPFDRMMASGPPAPPQQLMPPNQQLMQTEPAPHMTPTPNQNVMQGPPMLPTPDHQHGPPRFNHPPPGPGEGYGATPAPPVPPAPLNRPPVHPMSFPAAPLMGEQPPQSGNFPGNPNLPDIEAPNRFPTSASQTNVGITSSSKPAPPTPRGILKNTRSNLTTIVTCEESDENKGQIPPLNIKPPSHPPEGGFRSQVPVDTEHQPGSEDKQEFKEKLKRKTSSSPTAAPDNPLGTPPPRRNSNLTEIPCDEPSEEKQNKEHISSIGTVHRDRSPGQAPWKFDSRDRRESRDRDRDNSFRDSSFRDNSFRGRGNFRRSSRPYGRGRGSFESYAERARGFFMREGFPPPPPPPPPPEWPPYQQY